MRGAKAFLIGAAVTALLLGTPRAAEAQSSCGAYDFTGLYMADFQAGAPFEAGKEAGEVITTMPDAVCHHNRLLTELEAAYGPVVGYKAAATSAGAQKQLGLSGPVLGVFFDEMLVPDGSTVAIDSGARMIFELDLMVEVGSDAINEATTREEALAALSAVVPFIELGDLQVAKGTPITGPLLQAMNAGARSGVVGAPVPLGSLTVESIGEASGTLAQDGTVVAEAPVTALLGHPLDAVLWIVENAQTRGLTLKAGDLLSLGSLGRFQIASPGLVEAQYIGFADEPVTVAVTLE